MPEEVHHIEWQHLNKYRYYGFHTAFMLSVSVAVYPAELIKTRLQTQRTRAVYRGTVDVAMKTVRREGARGLYRGFLVSQLGILTGHLYTTSYEVSRANIPRLNDATRGFIAGGVAAVLEQFFSNPVEVLSQRLMVQGQGRTPAQGACSVAKEVFRQHRVSGFYRGFLASLLTGCVWSSVWWASYGAYLNVLGQLAPEGTSHILIHGISGALSGLNSAVVGNPFDIVDTRLKVEGSKSMTRVLKDLLEREGAVGLFKGVHASIISWVPSSVVWICGYEAIKKLSLNESDLHNCDTLQG